MPYKSKTKAKAKRVKGGFQCPVCGEVFPNRASYGGHCSYGGCSTRRKIPKKDDPRQVCFPPMPKPKQVTVPAKGRDRGRCETCAQHRGRVSSRIVIVYHQAIVDTLVEDHGFGGLDARATATTIAERVEEAL